MFEHYSEKAKQTIVLAKQEASESQSCKIGPEHILLGLLQDPVLTGHVLDRLSAKEIREAVLARQSTETGPSALGDLTLSEDSQQVLAFAMEEAKRLGSRDVANEHILLGLMRPEHSYTAQLLKYRGISAEYLYEHMPPRKLQREYPSKSTSISERGGIGHQAESKRLILGLAAGRASKRAKAARSDYNGVWGKPEYQHTRTLAYRHNAVTSSW